MRFRVHALRLMLISAILVFALGVLSVHAQEPTTLNVYIDADTNISDWLSNIVTPGFEAANPQYKLNVVIARGGISMDDVINRTMAAQQTGSDPQVDVIEGMDPSGFTK